MMYNKIVGLIKGIGQQIVIRDNTIYTLKIENVDFEYNNRTNRISIYYENDLQFYCNNDHIFNVFDVLNNEYVNVFNKNLEDLILAFDRLKTMVEEYYK